MGFWTRDELRKGRLYWLLDFTWGGVTYRFTDEGNGLDVTIGSDSYRYDAGLEWGGTLADEVDPFTDSPDPKEASFTLWFPPGVDVPERVARGYNLGSSTGKLMQWCSGTTRVATVIDGKIRDPEYATKFDAVTCSLEELPFADTNRWPPALAKVDATSWPGAADKAVGEFYPWVLGVPGYDPSNSRMVGSPGLHLDASGATNHLLIAGHVVLASRVIVRNGKDGTADSFNVATKADGYGRLISYIDLDAPSGVGIAVDPDNPYWVQFTTTHGGGLVAQDGVSELRGAGDMIFWWLQRSSLRWDRGRLAAIRDRLNGYVLDMSMVASPDNRPKPWELVQERILSLLPVSVRTGPNGLYLAWFDWLATEATADPARFDVDAGLVQRASAIAYSSIDMVANEFRFSYKVDGERNKPTATYILTGSESTLASESTASPHISCRMSDAEYGTIVKEWSSSEVYDPATAGKVCQWQAAAFAMQSRSIVYTAPRDYGHLDPGRAVVVNDTAIGLYNAIALVDRVPWRSGTDLDFTLRLLSVPGRDSLVSA